MKEAYINECKQIKQSAEYSAEAHHILSKVHKTLSYLFQVIPAGVAAITGALVAANKSPDSLLWWTVSAAVVAAVANILDPKKNYQDHLNAAKNFTTMKHDARFLHESQSLKLSDEAFAVAVENLHNRYNDLVKLTPPTTDWAFAWGRWRIHKQLHQPDKAGDKII
jgi:hypothetical protein